MRHEVGDARSLVVGVGSAELILGDFLVRYRLDQRPAQ